MDPQGSENTVQEFRTKSENLEASVNESSNKNEISEEPLQEPLIKQEISEDLCDEEYVEFEITENPLNEHSMKIEVADKNYLAVTPQEEDDNMLPKDPLEPSLRNRPLGPDAKLMLINVIRYFQKFKLKRAKETGEDMNVNLTVAEATGVSESAVKRLLHKYRNKGIEEAIGSAVAKKNGRKRKADTKISAGDEEPTVTVTTKKKK